MKPLSHWLHQVGLSQYASAFEANEITFEDAPSLTDSDLKELGVAPLGHRRRLLRAIAELSSIDPAGPQRRHVTMLFADLVGSTQLSTQLDPEDLAHVIQSFQRETNAAILRSGGFVARHIGDGMLAYFGWPTASENDAERAVRAGLAVVHSIRLIADAVQKLQVRVGIETGLVVIGALVGPRGSEELSVVGEAANLAARLQSAAEPDEIVIGPGTRQRLGAIFELSPRKLLKLKGFAGPMPVWRVLGESQVPLRFMAGQRNALAGLVGRQRELETLSEAWETARRGHGRAVLVSGEAGIGKSRIAAAFVQGLEKRDQHRLFYQCSAVHAGAVLHPVLRELERSADFDPADAPQTRFAKLEQLFQRSGASAPPGSLAVVADLLGISAPVENRARGSDPQRSKALTIALLLERIDRLAHEQPVLVLIEDAHWSDATTLELFHTLLRRIAHMPVLAIITSRPDGLAAWHALPEVTALPVTRLAAGETVALINHLAGSTRLPPHIVSEVQDKTDGVPLFVEELTKAILEARAGGAESETSQRVFRSPGFVPATLQDSLMERLDRLAWAKELAQIGAVLGTEFSRELLSLVSEMSPSRVEQGLERLVQAELLHRGDGPTDYGFRHALVYDVAYASVLRSRRRLLHGRTATILLERFPQVSVSQPEVIARHLTEARLFADAVKWWCKAGHRSARASSNLEAIEHFTHALRLLERLPPGPARADEELEIRIELGVPLAASAGYMAPAFSANFTRALELSRNSADVTKLFPALWAQYTAVFSGGDMGSAEVMSANFLKAAQRQKSRAMLMIGHRIHGNAKLARGDLQGARRELEQSLGLYRDPDDHDLTYFYGQNQRVAALSYLGLAMHQQGYLEQALARSVEAAARAEELDHFHTKGYALAGVLLIHMLRRDPTALRRAAHVMAELSDRHGGSGWSLLARLGVAVAEALADKEAAPLQAIRAGVQELQSRGWNFWVPWFLMEEVRVLLARRDGVTAKRLVNETKRLVELQDYRLCEPELCILRASMLANEGRPKMALKEYQRAVDIALAQDALLPALRAATALGSLAVGSKGELAALRQLARLRARFSEGLQSPDLVAAGNLLGTARLPGTGL